MSTPKVSIVILSYFHPEITEICLNTLNYVTDVTDGPSFEVVVVDNGSDQRTLDYLRDAKDQRLIDVLVETGQNNMFSEGNNIGVRSGNQGSEYVLLLNSDVAFLRPDWLAKQLGWMEGTIEHRPSVWNAHPTQPAPGPYDIVSIGWSHDGTLSPDRTQCIRPEGWCIMYRRSVWEDMDLDFPWYYGLDQQVTNIVKKGHKCGVLSQYGPYLVHREQGSEASFPDPSKRAPDMINWYSGAHIESLDFTLGPYEHDSYLWW
jgi:GT2 family glycosyltransferase